MSLLIPGTNSIKDTGYSVANSLRFDSGSSDRLTRTFGSGGSSALWTWSGWIKRSKLGSRQSIFTAYSDASNLTRMEFTANDELKFNDENSGNTNGRIVSTAKYRDPSAWMHIVFHWDSSDGTSSDRLRMYVNNERITSFSDTGNAPSTGSQVNTAITHEIGSMNNSNFFEGYMAEVVFINGANLDPDQFGEYDEDSPTIWKPKDVSGLTFGTTGFHLDFEDSSALGNDVSGNNNDWTVSNLTSVDQSTDTCTNNFATLNPLYKQDHAFSQGNLGYTSSASDWDSAPTTIAASSGKYYCEMKVTGTASGVTRSVLGICDERDGNLVAESEFGLTSSVVGDTVGYSSGDVHKNSSADSGSFDSFGINDVLGMYVDLDNGKVYFSKNGTMQNSGDPTSGSTGTGAISITTGATYLFGATGYGGGASQMNFGSPPYSISSGNADPNGYGNFEYGTQNYYALNSKNLAEFG
jgi:hypothetical protein